MAPGASGACHVLLTGGNDEEIIPTDVFVVLVEADTAVVSITVALDFDQVTTVGCSFLLEAPAANCLTIGMIWLKRSLTGQGLVGSIPALRL